MYTRRVVNHPKVTPQGLHCLYPHQIWGTMPARPSREGPVAALLLAILGLPVCMGERGRDGGVTGLEIGEMLAGDECREPGESPGRELEILRGGNGGVCGGDLWWTDTVEGEAREKPEMTEASSRFSAVKASIRISSNVGGAAGGKLGD